MDTLLVLYIALGLLSKVRTTNGHWYSVTDEIFEMSYIDELWRMQRGQSVVKNAQDRYVTVFAQDPVPGSI